MPNSNERLLLYLDAPIYAIGDGRNWSVDDSLPRLSISRLAYDFQHMINSYQLFEKKGVYQENWLKSLLSMSVEDLVAQKLFGDFSSSPYNNRFEKLNNCKNITLFAHIVLVFDRYSLPRSINCGIFLAPNSSVNIIQHPV